MTKKDYFVAKTPITKEFGDNVAELIKAIRIRNKRQFSSRSLNLYEQLLLPIQKNISKKTRLIISPDKQLALLPFETLLTKFFKGNDFSKAPYLLNKYSISYQYSALTFLEQESVNQNLKDGFLAFAPVFRDGSKIANATRSTLAFVDSSSSSNDDYRSSVLSRNMLVELSESENEVLKISEMSKKNNFVSNIFLHEDATETNVKNEAKQNYKYIHIATHGIYNQKKPKLSGLIFSQNNSAKDDGVLYESESYLLSSNCDLLTLSACETGLGEYVKGEGILSLAKGFYYSGAKNVINSLWRVSDENTKKLMIALYENIFSGKSYSESLRNAKRELISKKSTAFPKNWAGFILLGK